MKKVKLIVKTERQANDVIHLKVRCSDWVESAPSELVSIVMLPNGRLEIGVPKLFEVISFKN